MKAFAKETTMSKIAWVDVTEEDTQKCLIALNERLEEIGITKDNIISVERKEHTEKGKYQVTLFVYYWSART